MNSLRSRLTLTYSAVAAFCVLAVVFSANVLVDYHFSKLVQTRIVREEHQYLDSLAQAYSPGKGWDQDSLSVLGMGALGSGFILKIDDVQGSTVWDARLHNDGMCVAMLGSISKAMENWYPGWKGRYKEESFSIQFGNGIVGAANFGYYGPFYFNEAEQAFLNALNLWTSILGAIALAASAALGFFMSQRIAGPIRRLSETAHQIRLGRWESQVSVGSKIREIDELSISIDSLAKSLLEQDDLRKRMTADVSHELRTPLGALQARLEAMIDGVFPIDQGQLDQCRTEVIRLTKLVRELEGLFHLDFNPIVLNPEAVHLQQFLAQVGGLFEAEAKRKGVELTCRSDDSIFSLDVDKNKQILINLLSNAFKATPGGGRISLSASVQRSTSGGSELALTISDTGTGIPEKELPFLFERFYRVDPSRNRETGGTGIGLSIAWSMARAQGGRIEVESKLGQGTTFTVSIPEPSTNPG